MKLPSRFTNAYKALSQLGFSQVGLFGLYRLGLMTGHYRRQLSQALSRINQINNPQQFKLQPRLVKLPDRDDLCVLLGDQINQLYAQADEIVDGKVRLFGGSPAPLILEPPAPLMYWTQYDDKQDFTNSKDIKYTWEPARFGWAYTLAMAYYLSSNETYSDRFWDYTDRFLAANPPYLGPNWTSAQEVAIRLIAIAFVYQVFLESNHTTPERAANLARSIAIHAERIPPTMVYARSQNNNHLISEALGLYTASAVLPGHPRAAKWHDIGWKWLQHAFRTQIEPDGSYVQHSTNYHRLMLQSGLWAYAVHDAAFSTESIPDDIHELLVAATSWLEKLTDPETGYVPNLGHNDGAYIMPLTIQPYHDYRPVLDAAQRIFFHQANSSVERWKDMGIWLTSGNRTVDNKVEASSRPVSIGATDNLPYIIINEKNGSWAYFRTARYHSRPAHADQLHVDLWWRGLNLAPDAGTYLYNSPPPWDNGLTHAAVHNTITIDGLDLMNKVSKFLYLDWVQAKVDEIQTSPQGIISSIIAHHDGYRKLGIAHARKISALDDGSWEITDHLEGPTGSIHKARLHWLLPDWEYQILDEIDKANAYHYKIGVQSPYGLVSLRLGHESQGGTTISAQNIQLQLVRAGKLLYGSGEANPINGWYSPTYGEKIPALACILEVTQTLPITIKSHWILPE